MKDVENLKKDTVNDVEKSSHDLIDINYQAKFLTICPLPPRAKKYDYITKNGKIKKAYETEFNSKMGNIELSIIGKKKYGHPYGRDILIILFLIREALIQDNNGIIEMRSPISKYLKTFDIHINERNYNDAKRRFKRVRYSSWFWDENTEDQRKIEKNLSMSYLIIRRWCVFFDKKDQHPLYDSYIELSPEFWDYIKSKRIPYDLNLVKKIKDKPILINLYLLLVYRVYEIWKKKPNKPVFIPFFKKDEGLIYQLSPNYESKRDFKSKMINKWLPIIHQEWKDCPCFVEKISSKKKLRGKKIYKDGLTIHVKSVSQLHIPPHWPKLMRQSQEEVDRELKKEA